MLVEDEDSTPSDDNTISEDGSPELVDSLPVHHTVRNLMIVLAVVS